MLGEMTGELVKPGSSSDGKALVFLRSDLADEPIAAHLYTGKMGNIFRFVNHRCKSPAVAIKPMAISGKFRMMVCTVRAVTTGEEITARWGKDSLPAGTACRCEDCIEEMVL